MSRCAAGLRAHRRSGTLAASCGQDLLPGLEARRVALAGLLFLLSGAAALVYQVAWQRILALHSGVGLYSVAMIVAAFMAGLGIGSHLGGRLSERTGALAALRPVRGRRARDRRLRRREPASLLRLALPARGAPAEPLARGGLAHFGALLPPTLLMGMSLPLLVRAMLRDVATAGRTIGYLYGINMLGAAAGAFAAPWLLLPWAGIPGAVTVAAAGNLLAGTGALVLARGVSAARTQPEAPPQDAARMVRGTRSACGSRSTRCRASWRSRSRSSGSGWWTWP